MVPAAASAIALTTLLGIDANSAQQGLRIILLAPKTAATLLLAASAVQPPSTELRRTALAPASLSFPARGVWCAPRGTTALTATPARLDLLDSRAACRTVQFLPSLVTETLSECEVRQEIAFAIANPITLDQLAINATQATQGTRFVRTHASTLTFRAMVLEQFFRTQRKRTALASVHHDTLGCDAKPAHLDTAITRCARKTARTQE